MSEKNNEEMHFKGAPVSEGIAIGVPIFLSNDAQDEVPDFPITMGEVEDEIARYRKALSSSRADLRKLQEHLSKEGSSDVASIIDAHIQMLDDPLMTTHIEKKIRDEKKNIESIFHSVISDYELRFSQTPDAFFQQRLVDIRDLSNRVLRNLCPEDSISTKEIPPNSIIFARELIPSDTASIQATRVSAVVTQFGGNTSHAALIARAKGIPYVASIDMVALQQAEGQTVIVDGLTGDIIINPTSNTIEKYERLKKRLTAQYQQMEEDRHLKAETLDGYTIEIFANINSIHDIDLVHHHKAAGIGLFRSEYLFLHDIALLSDEERQQKAYEHLVQKSNGFPIVIRVMDIGGDKYPELFAELPKEPNPVLGCRGIRFLMKRKDIFRTQLRAIFKANNDNNIRILLPFISDTDELRDVKFFIESVKDELEKEHVSFRRDVPMGVMLEVPSAILVCDTLAQECDFLEIGTNDLAQYTLGIDRANPAMSDFYYPTHPSVVRMIKMAIMEGKKYGKPVTVCGEIASNPLFTPLLLGLGVSRFSCAPRFIPIIKRTVRQTSLIQAYEIATHVLTLKTASEIIEYLVGQLNNPNS